MTSSNPLENISDLAGQFASVEAAYKRLLKTRYVRDMQQAQNGDPAYVQLDMLNRLLESHHHLLDEREVFRAALLRSFADHYKRGLPVGQFSTRVEMCHTLAVQIIFRTVAAIVSYRNYLYRPSPDVRLLLDDERFISRLEAASTDHAAQVQMLKALIDAGVLADLLGSEPVDFPPTDIPKEYLAEMPSNFPLEDKNTLWTKHLSYASLGDGAREIVRALVGCKVLEMAIYFLSQTIEDESGQVAKTMRGFRFLLIGKTDKLEVNELIQARSGIAPNTLAGTGPLVNWQGSTADLLRLFEGLYQAGLLGDLSKEKAFNRLASVFGKSLKPGWASDHYKNIRASDQTNEQVFEKMKAALRNYTDNLS